MAGWNAAGTRWTRRAAGAMKTRIHRPVALANGRGSDRATWRWRVEQLSAVDVGRALAWLAAGSRVAIEHAPAEGHWSLSAGERHLARHLHRQRGISHNGLLTVLSGTRWLERCEVFLALGRWRYQQAEQDFRSERFD
jgi:hypothetical protein